MELLQTLPEEYVNAYIICNSLLNRSNVLIFDKGSPFIKKYWRGLFILPWATSFYLAITVYLLRNLSGEVQFFDLANSLPVFLVATQGAIKAVFLLSKKKKIQDIMTRLGNMWRINDLTDEQNQAKYARLHTLHRFHKAFYWINIIGSIQYMMVPFLETLFRKFVLNQECEMLLPFLCSLPFDPPASWFRYVIIYIFQSYGMFLLIFVYLGAEFLSIAFCALISVQFLLLQEDLTRIQPETANEGIKQTTRHDFGNKMNINIFIEKHSDLLTLCKDLDEIYNKIIFLNLLFATIIICFFGFVAKFARGPMDMMNNFIGVFASILPIYNLCYYGEMVAETSLGIAYSAYKNQWYNGDKNYQKKIYFVMKRSQKACYLTSMKYTSITLTAFTTVISTTWSYFSLATQLYEE